MWAGLEKGRTFRTADDYWQSRQHFQAGLQGRLCPIQPCDLADRPRPDDNKQRIKNVINAVAKVSMKNLVKIVEGDARRAHSLKNHLCLPDRTASAEQIALRFRRDESRRGGIDFDRNLILIRQAVKKTAKRKDRYVGDPKTVSGIREIPIDADLSA